MIGRSHVALDRRELAAHEVHGLDAVPTSGACRVPSRAVVPGVSRDIGWLGLQREMGRVERNIKKKRSIRVSGGVLRKVLDSMLSDGRCRMVASRRLDPRQRPVILEMNARMEIAPDVLQEV